MIKKMKMSIMGVRSIADRDHLHDGPKIIAALKVGRAMRDSYYTSKVAPGDNLDFDNAVEAWDAALKEEV